MDFGMKVDRSKVPDAPTGSAGSAWKTKRQAMSAGYTLLEELRMLCGPVDMARESLKVRFRGKGDRWSCAVEGVGFCMIHSARGSYLAQVLDPISDRGIAQTYGGTALEAIVAVDNIAEAKDTRFDVARVIATFQGRWK